MKVIIRTNELWGNRSTVSFIQKVTYLRPKNQHAERLVMDWEAYAADIKVATRLSRSLE